MTSSLISKTYLGLWIVWVVTSAGFGGSYRYGSQVLFNFVQKSFYHLYSAEYSTFTFHPTTFCAGEGCRDSFEDPLLQPQEQSSSAFD